jgi:hypothetical protein
MKHIVFFSLIFISHNVWSQMSHDEQNRLAIENAKQISVLIRNNNLPGVDSVSVRGCRTTTPYSETFVLADGEYTVPCVRIRVTGEKYIQGITRIFPQGQKYNGTGVITQFYTIADDHMESFE